MTKGSLKRLNVNMVAMSIHHGGVLKSYQDQILKMEWMLRSVSELSGAVKDYVPEKKVFYERIAERTVDED